MKNKIKKLKHNKYFPYIIIGVTIFIIIILLIIKSIITGATISVYGNRLKGIKDVPFTSSSQKQVIEVISSNEKASNVKINVKGKIINITFEVAEDVSVEDARNIASSSLEKISDKIKSFYDIQVFVLKPNETGTEQETQEDGKTKIVKEFPIAGYKNSKRDGFVW